MNNEDAAKRAVADEILRQIKEGGNDKEYFEGYEETVRKLEDVEACFTQDGMAVWFSDYQLGPHSAGIPNFLISYDLIKPYLTTDGWELLGI